MSVDLTPAELGFRRPFSTEVAETLHLSNPNNQPVAFKVKTTAPKQYCVRPNSGRIEAGGSVEVQVLLQAMKEDPPLEAKCRDKFLVQSVPIAADQESGNIATIWTNIEQTAKGSIQEKKIRVSFLPADGSAPAQTPVRKSVGGATEPPPTYSSPTSALSTPAATRADIKSEPATTTTDSPSVNGSQTATGAAVASVAAIASTSAEELQVQLAAAKAQIARLTRQAADQAGLRQRKPEAPVAPTQSSLAPQKTPAGVPVPIVALISLLSFLIAYLLF